MECQILFSRKITKNISKHHLLKFVPSMQSVNKRFISFYLKMKLEIPCPLLIVSIGDSLHEMASIIFLRK